MSTQTIRCPNCNHEIDAAARFCAQCGLVQPGAHFTDPQSAATAKAAVEAAARDLIGERLRKATVGRFDVLRRLGRGGMAAVYLAYDLRLARKVALKVMLPQLELTEGMADRFVQEAKTAARLTHPNIIIVHSVEELGDLVLIVMSLVDGASMDHVIPKLSAGGTDPAGQLPVAIAQSVLIQLATALEYAHAERIVHRDIKPSNVMITGKGDAIVTDFGIAKVTADAAHTKTSMVMGTPTYMSPEQCMGQSVTGASDQYSLGAVAYELFAGEPPFAGLQFELVNAHIGDDPVPLLQRRPDAPPAIAAAIMRMLAKQPADRFASMTEVADALAHGFNVRDPTPRQLLGAAAVAARDESLAGGFHTPRSPLPLPKPPLTAAEPAADIEPEHIDVSLEVGQSTVLTLDAATLTLGRGEHHAVKWEASDNTTVRITPDGTVEGLTAGEATITAIIDDQRVPYHITVRPVTITSLRLSASMLTIDAGDEFTIEAFPLGADGITREGIQVEWQASEPRLFEVLGSGRFAALAEGEAILTASALGVSATTSVRVAPARIVAIDIDRTSLEIPAADEITLQATARDGRGNTLAGRTITWTSDAPDIVAIDSNGQLLALAEGSTVVRAFAEGTSSEVMVRVTPAQVAEMKLDRLPVAVMQDETFTLNATPPVGVAEQPSVAAPPRSPAPARARMPVSRRSGRGWRFGGVAALATAATIIALVAWPSPDNATRTDATVVVPPSATPSPAPVRQDTVSAPVQPSPRATTAPVTPNARPDSVTVDRIDIQSPARQVAEGATLRLSGRAIGRNRQAMEAVALRWLSEDSAIATVSQGGMVSGHMAGNAVIRASGGGKTATMLVTVTAPTTPTPLVEPPSPVATRLELRVGSSTLQMGTVGRWSARGFAASGVEIPNLEFVVRAEPAALARVSSNGEITPLGVGRITIVASVRAVSDSQSVTISAPVEPVVQPPVLRPAPPPDTAPVRQPVNTPSLPSGAEIAVAVEPLLVAIRSTDRTAIPGYFRTPDAAKGLLDWLSGPNGRVIFAGIPARAASNGTTDPLLALDLTVEWKNAIGQCRRGNVQLAGRIIAARIQVESAIPPATTPLTPCRGR